MTREIILVYMAQIRYEIEHPGEQWPPDNTQLIQAYIDDELEAIKRLESKGIVLIGSERLAMIEMEADSPRY